MNDRFKFRAWDTFTEKMIQNHISICEGELYEWCPDGLHIKHDIGDSAIVMQCTGLKDKNGLENIYEYDIINIDGIKIGNIYEQEDLLKDTTNFVIKRMGTKEWRDSEQEAIKRGCYYAE